MRGFAKNWQMVPQVPNSDSFDVNLIEDAAVREMRLLGLLPAAEHVIDGDELHVDELFGVLGRHGRITRP